MKKIDEITEYIFLEDTGEKADVALIFGTRFYELPLEECKKLYQEGRVGYFLFSGGVNRVNGVNEAEEMKKTAIKLGIPADRLLVEDKSTNTLENVLFSREMIDKQLGWDKVKSVMAISKHYHSRRTLMTLKKHLPSHVKLLIRPYEIYGFTRDNWHESEKGRQKVYGEVERCKKYQVRGDIEELQ